MKVSLSWLVIFLFIVFVVYFFWKGCNIYESFLSDPFVGGVYTLNDISIHTCPNNTSSFVNPNGLTLCCEGTLLGSTCNGKEVCSLSGNAGSMPSCSEYYGQYLESKGSMLCPTSMPNYFENGKGGGCTAGKRTSDGKRPADDSNRCVIYSSEKRDTSDINSCTNIRRMERARCFRNGDNNVRKTLEHSRPDSDLPYIRCRYNTDSCIQEDTFTESILYNKDIMNKTNESNDPIEKLKFCGPYEAYSIQKEIDIDDVKDMDVFPFRLAKDGGKAAERRAIRIAMEEERKRAIEEERKRIAMEEAARRAAEEERTIAMKQAVQRAIEEQRKNSIEEQMKRLFMPWLR